MDLEDLGQNFKKEFFCYIVHNANGNTYNGYTVNLTRRLRQHNGYLKGGARATHNRGPWNFLVVLTSTSWDCISTAMRHEWSIKYPTRKRPRPKQFNGPVGRLQSLKLVFDHMARCEENPVITCYVDTQFYDIMTNFAAPYSTFVTLKHMSDLSETSESVPDTSEHALSITVPEINTPVVIEKPPSRVDSIHN